MATQGCDQSADAGAGMAGAKELAPLKQERNILALKR
jgi:hypothetical protein